MAADEQHTDKSLALTEEHHGRLRRAWDSQTAFKVSAGFLLAILALGIWVVISGKPSTPGTGRPAAQPPARRQATGASSTPTTTAARSNQTSCSLPPAIKACRQTEVRRGCRRGRWGA